MKRILLFCALLAAAILPAENLLDPAKTKFDKFVTDKQPGAKLTAKADNGKVLLGSDREKGVAAVILNSGKTVRAKANTFLSYRYLAESAGEKATLITRFRFYDGSGKVAWENWSAQQPVTPGESTVYVCPVRANGAWRPEITVYFRGVFQATLSDFVFSETPPAGENGNLIYNGSFENPAMYEFYPQNFLNGKPAPASMAKSFRCERSTLKSHSGKYSLYCVSPQAKSSLLLNMASMNYAGKQKYRFSAWCYFAGGKGGKISASFGFRDANGKLIKYRFPKADSTPGRWNQLKDEFYPPEGTASVFVLFWVNGDAQVYLDDFYFGPAEQPQKAGPAAEKPAAAAPTGAVLLQDSADFTLWCDGANAKPPRTGVPAGIRPGKTYRFECAANESEPFSVILNAKKKYTDVTLEAANLQCGGNLLPAAALKIRTVGFIYLKNPENPTVRGWNADPILPEDHGAAGPESNLPFFVELKVPSGQAPGVYTGKLRLKGDGALLAEVPVEVRVRAFELPEEPVFRSYFYAWAGQPHYKSQDPRDVEQIWRDFCELYKEHRFTGNQAMHPPRVPWSIKDGKLVIDDWSGFDAKIDLWRTRYGLRCFPVIPLNFLGHYHGWIDGGKTVGAPGKSPFADGSWTSPESLRRIGEFAAQYQEHVEKRFPDCIFTAYVFDEPLPEVQPELARITAAIHAAAPKMKIFITKEVTPTLTGVNFWCHPLAPGLYDETKVLAALRRGDSVWYYNWVVGFDNTSWIEGRLYPWRIYAAHGSGGLLWQTTEIPGGLNIWRDFDKSYKCGAATIFYPPRPDHPADHVLPSLRSREIKEGIDDFDYFKLLEARIEAKYPGMGYRRLRESLAAVLPTDPFAFRNDRNLMREVRSRVADEIESFDRLPAVLVSMPGENAETQLSSVRMTLCAPAGTLVAVGGKPCGSVPAAGKLEFNADLEKSGLNELHVRLTCNGKTENLVRRYTLRRDVLLDRLAELNRSANDADAAAHLKKFGANARYTQADRDRTAALVNQLERTSLQTQLAAAGKGKNPAAGRMAELAQTSFECKAYDRTRQQLEQAVRLNRAGAMANCQVKLEPVSYKGHPGFALDNGIIRVSFTIMGGRIYSFKIRGVECLNPGDYANTLPAAARLRHTVPLEEFGRKVTLGGYADENGCGRYQATLLDWDVEFLELTPNRIRVAVSSDMIEKKFFRIRRVMTLAAGSRDLVMDYTITNKLEPGSVNSDDPGSYEWPWRGRFLPAVGQDGKRNDQLIVPTAPEYRLPETVYDPAKPVRFERKSIPLAKHWAGVRDQKSGCGFAVIGDRNITHGYVWFDTRTPDGDYTLELPRSTFGKGVFDKEPNQPFRVLPGREADFQLILRGLSGTESVEKFMQEVEK